MSGSYRIFLKKLWKSNLPASQSKFFYEKVNFLRVHACYYSFNFNNWFFSKEKLPHRRRQKLIQ
jgi:hypothetical protein